MWLPVVAHGTFNMIASFSSSHIQGYILEALLHLFSLLLIRHRLLPLLHHHHYHERSIHTLVDERVVVIPHNPVSLAIKGSLSIIAFYLSMYGLFEYVLVLLYDWTCRPFLNWEFW